MSIWDSISSAFGSVSDAAGKKAGELATKTGEAIGTGIKNVGTGAMRSFNGNAGPQAPEEQSTVANLAEGGVNMLKNNWVEILTGLIGSYIGSSIGQYIPGGKASTIITTLVSGFLFSSLGHYLKGMFNSEAGGENAAPVKTQQTDLDLTTRVRQAKERLTANVTSEGPLVPTFG